ncbi:centromere protein J isoform X2 [Rhinatrema bivittatum]|nr:centromere protein J isoform X2 [Rhinatrema bivittatum]
MEQIQRLMEEQKKLLVLVSGQKTFPGENSVYNEQTSEQSLGEDSSSDLHADKGDLSQSTNEKKYSEAAHTEERPIVSGIKETKQSFEEFLEEQMRLEEQRLKQTDQLQILEPVINKSMVKRPFLKRGDGLARFTNAKSKLSKIKQNQLMAQQRTEDKTTAKSDRQQMQRKTAPPSITLLSENVITTCNQIAKPKNSSAISSQKITMLRNHNGNNLSPSTMKEQSENKPDGQLKSSLWLEINSNLETNKDNIMEHAKQAFEIDGKLRKNLEGVEKLPISIMLASTCSTIVPSKKPENFFELSFQKRFEKWEKEKEKENLELDEFLLLEEAAEDISFSSNSSFVLKLLAQDQQISKGRRMSSTPVKLGQQQQASVLNSIVVNSKTQQTEHAAQANKIEADETQADSDSRDSGTRLNEQYNKAGDKLFVASCMMNDPSLRSIKLNADEQNSDITSDSEDDLDNTITSEKGNIEKLVFSNREDNPKCQGCQVPSENIGKENKSRDQDLDLSDQEDYSKEESSMIENKNENITAISHHSTSYLNGNNVEFDDERTWADLEEDELHPVTDIYTSKDKAQSVSSVPDKVIKRKVASIKKGEEQSKEKMMDSIASSPPVSNLMIKLFPSLKPKQKPDSYVEQDTRVKAGQEETIEDTVRSQLLKKKLVELETEIERFKIENATLAKLREEREQALEALRKEVTDFEQQKTKELAKIEEFKKEEMKKLQKERKIFEKYATAARAIPDKKERDEIQALKQQLTDLQEELKRKEARWSTTHTRLRNQIEAVTKENAELRQETKALEKIRLETWKKEALENKEVESNRVALKRAASLSPPYRINKNQSPCPGSQAEKSNKSNCRSNSPTKGKAVVRFKPIPVGEPNSSDKVKINLAESSGISLSSISCKEPSVPSKSYISGIKGNDEIQEEISYADGKVVKILKNGCHIIHFPNGTRKDVSADSKTITVTFFNGDVKQVMPDQRVIYYYADAHTTHTTYPDGLEVLHFSNGQIEKHYPDGKKEITFPDQTIKNLFMDGREESIFPDGTIVRVQLDGSKIIEFDNGQRELHTSQFKRREYPDGTVKTVYNDGNQETKYISGRVRVKDKDGNVLMDTKL